jgi:hypothetical protein
MKKLSIMIVSFALATLMMVSCGPSAKEIEEKRIADSILMADSIALVQAEQQKIIDSITLVEAEKVKADSIEAAKTKKHVKK